MKNAHFVFLAFYCRYSSTTFRPVGFSRHSFAVTAPHQDYLFYCTSVLGSTDVCNVECDAIRFVIQTKIGDPVLGSSTMTSTGQINLEFFR